MNNYQMPAPRVALGFVAAIMTAVTMGVFVVLPSRMESDAAFAVLAAARDASGSCSPEPTESAESE